MQDYKRRIENNNYHVNDIDLKLMHEFKFGKNNSRSLQLSLDVFNVLNLINNNWGHVYFVTNVNNYTANLLTFVKDANTSFVNATPFPNQINGDTCIWNFANLQPSQSGVIVFEEIEDAPVPK